MRLVFAFLAVVICASAYVYAAATMRTATHVTAANGRVHIEPEFLEHQTVPRDWMVSDEAPASSSLLHLLFAIKHEEASVASLQSLVDEVSHPHHANYGKYLDMHEVSQHLRIKPHAVATIQHFIYSHLPHLKPFHQQLFQVLPSKDWIKFECTVDDAQKLLDTQFVEYTHKHTQERYLRTKRGMGYTVTKEVASVIDFIGGVSRLHRMTPKVTAPMLEQNSNEKDNSQLTATAYNVTVDFLRNLYNIPPNYAAQHPINSQAVVEFLGEYYNDTDLQLYLSSNGVPNQEVRTLIGPNNQLFPGFEASLDIQVIMGLAPGVPTDFWSYAGLRNNSEPPSEYNQEPFLNWMVQLGNTGNPPAVFSISYDDDEATLPLAYMTRLNTEFLKAAARGLSLLFSAGDDGAGGPDVRSSGLCKEFRPSFPSSSPYVTSIGGTQLNSNLSQEVVSSSSTGSRITTGGGFSTVFTQPAYQATFVQNYLRLGGEQIPPPYFFNAQNRAYPDISAMATNYIIYLNQTTHVIGGTSASAPVVSAIVALLNNQRFHSGKAPLGFLNPLIYSLAAEPSGEYFNDVTSGDSNRCSAIPTHCCYYGYPATVGWDAVTGVGTPNFGQLSQAVTQL